jgi:apolipoprotein N-acyltransferase
MSSRVRAAWLVGSAVATFLAFPQPVAGRVIDLGVLASFLAPACFVLGLRGLAPRRAALVGFGAGLLGHALVFSWIYVVTVHYGHAWPPLGVLAASGLALYPAAFAAAFAAGSRALARGSATGLPGAFAGAALWTALDHAKNFVLTGFPWALLGYAQHHNPALLGLAPFTGVFGLSFAVALGGLALAELGAAHSARRPLPRRALAAGLALVALHGAGALEAARDPGPAAGTLRVGIVQGNIDQGIKWDPEWAERTLSIYEELTRRAVGEGARVVLWPETAVPGSPDGVPGLADRLAALARETRTTLVVGAVGVDWVEGRPRYFDSAFLWDGTGGFLARYDKAHLVPFGEYVPLRGLLGHFVQALARGVADTDVHPGAGPRALALGPFGDLAQPVAGAAAVPPGEVTVGAPICYELLFPDLVRRFVRDGAQALLAITNDAWYGRTGAPYQFLAITALRSAENRVWTVRAANTGVSGFIDHRGRVREATRIFERDHRVADIELRPAPAGGSFYARHGDWFAAACWAASGVALAAGIRRGRGRTESA